MGKTTVPPGWTHQAYRFEVDRPERIASVFSHTGARCFAWNHMLGVIEEQCRAEESFRLLALRQGARAKEAEEWAKKVCAIPYLVEMNEKRSKDHEAKVAAGTRKPGEYQAVSEWCPWGAEAMRYVWNRVKDEVAPWWAESSKECYSSAFRDLAQALKNHFDSRDGTRRGPHVGWPNYKGRSGRQSVAFTTGAITVVDRHHIQLPVIGVLRLKEPTDKLRVRLEAGHARILRSTLAVEGTKAYVSFGVVVSREQRTPVGTGLVGHDVGITRLITSSEGSVVENPKAGEQARKQTSRYLSVAMKKSSRVATSRSPRMAR